MPDAPSLLVITPLSPNTALILTPYSARGLTQTLEPFDPGSGQSIRESINGDTVDLFPRQFRKYQSTISCTDQATPCLDDAWKGQLVEVDCVHELNYLLGGAPHRPMVPGSSRIEGNFVFYRPRLIMMVLNIR